MIKGFSDFMEGNSSFNITTLPGVIAIDIVVVEIMSLIQFLFFNSCCSRDIIDLIFHVTLEDHVIKGLCEVMEGSSSLYIPTLPSLVATNIVVVDI